MGGNEEVEPMDTSDTPWFWYYLEECGRWHLFEHDPNNSFRNGDIENYYLLDPRGTLTMHSSGSISRIDFSAMLQTNLSTGEQRRIKRSYKIERNCSCFSEAPIFWESMDPKLPYQLVPLEESTPEHWTVANYVKVDGLLVRPIVSIYRIQNVDLWEMYCRKKIQLKRIRGVSQIQERRLFHGTDMSNVDSICKYNFDLRLAGQHGHVHGKGIYFATHATYADKYSSRSIDSSPLPFLRHSGTSKILFLARVMVGKSTPGQRHFQKPDHGSLENSHDSCVDDLNHPKMVVIFDPNQIYPEYMIQYT